MSNIIEIDFRDQLGVPEEPGQLALWRRFAAQAAPGPASFVPPAIDRQLTAAQPRLHPTAFALARALASFLRPDRDGTYWANPRRATILKRAGLTSLTTYKRHWPDVLSAFAIETRRRGKGSSNVFVWHADVVTERGMMGHMKGHMKGHNVALLEGPLYGPSEFVNQAYHENGYSAQGKTAAQDARREIPGKTAFFDGPHYGPQNSIKKEQRARGRAGLEAARTSARILACPEAAVIATRADLSPGRLEELLAASPLAVSSPALWLAAVEARLDAGHADPVGTAPAGMHVHGTHQPSPARVEELAAALAAVTLPETPTHEQEERA